MSWVKRRGANQPNPGAPPPVQMFDPNQHSILENQWQNQPAHNDWCNQPQQQQYQQVKQEPQQSYWQQPQSYDQSNLQYGQHQYSNDTQTNYYQNNIGYDQTQTYGNSYNNQAHTNAQPVAKTEGDAWGDWGWGEEDNLNVLAVQQSAITNHTPSDLGNAFSNDATWNWGVNDKQNLNSHSNSLLNLQTPQERKREVKEEDLAEYKLYTKEKKENNPEVVPPYPATDHSKRGKLNAAQWSTESQVSQESFDDILHTSESDKSLLMSQSSTVSHSSLSAQESQPGIVHQHLEPAPVKKDPSYKDLATNQFENSEIIAKIKQEPGENWPNPNPTPPLMPAFSTSSEESGNPYKRNKSTSSHFRPPKAAMPVYQTPAFNNQQVNLETVPDNSEKPEPVQSVNRSSVAKLKQPQQWPENNEAPINDRNQYLETGQLSEANLTDYSEVNLPQEVNDTLPPPGLRRMVPGQTERIDNSSTTIGGLFGDEPPPGLSRMVLGQTERDILNPQVLSTPDGDQNLPYDVTGPPEGLRRMVPGESSSPESTLRYQIQRNVEENDSEPELDRIAQHTSEPRSATIGADTPPFTSAQPGAQPPNRSETIDGGDSEDLAQDLRRGSKKDDKRREVIEGETHDNEVANVTNSIRNLTVGENLTDGQTSNASLSEQPAPRRQSRQESSDSDREPKKLSRNTRDRRSLEKSKRDKERENDRNRDQDRDRDRDRYSPDSYQPRKLDRRRYKEKRYDEDTDYTSDKEKDRRRDNRDRDYDRDYDRKYNSLRKDKDKDGRRKRDGRDYSVRDKRGEYYYNRYDEYETENRSRPSSRSDSVQESYRERGHEHDPRDRRHRDRERERYRDRRHRNPREMFNPYQGVAYDPYNPYYQQYQYYENLRRTNPQAYAEWYRKYYQQTIGQTSSYGGEDRASVHSGRSSANDELAKDSFVRPFDGLNTDSSLNLEDSSVAAQRLTPAKFSTAHVKASLMSGNLLRILPHYPMDGQKASVEVISLHNLLVNDKVFNELSIFPGPLVKGVTHKKTIIEYCQSKIRLAAYNDEIIDVDSYVLMWELLILLLRQNGMVVGTDIAELLLKNRTNLYERPSSVISSISSLPAAEGHVQETIPNQKMGSTQSILKEEEVTDKFREFLLYGSGMEALEWAMKQGLWGHALFLASKLDKRTYANVMMRFANGLTLNDPLQTLYQLLSGKMPAAVTCVSDEKWGDWKPHLAMILSNSTQRLELNRKAITTLGDTLRGRGSLYAAQFCYLMAEVSFGRYEDPQTRLALLGADHSRPFQSFATSEAMHMTEIYEYACGLNDSEFVIPEFQIYKYLIATQLADRGLPEKALRYLEKLSSYIVSYPASVWPNFVDKVCDLAERLKFHDLVDEVEDESQFGVMSETTRPDNSWLKDLKTVQRDYQAGLISHESVSNLASYAAPSLETDLQPVYEANSQDAWQQQTQFDSLNVPVQQQWQMAQQQPMQIEYQQQLQQGDYPSSENQRQQNYWANQPQEIHSQQQWGDQSNQYGAQAQADSLLNYGSDNAQTEEITQPEVSLPNQLPSSDERFSQEQDASQTKQSFVKREPVASPPQEKTQSTGWFGGIFSKLALKPKNQMKLPDDKNPKIVWDQDKKKWINVDGDSNDPAYEFKPPPKMADMIPKITPQGSFSSVGSLGIVASQSDMPGLYDVGQVSEQTLLVQPVSVNQTQGTQQLGGSSMVENQGQGNVIKGPPGNNMFKLQRGRNFKNSYVDIFNPGGKPGGPSSLPPSTNISAPIAPQMDFFVPQPVADPNAPIDFLTPGGVPQFGEQQKRKTNSS